MQLSRAFSLVELLIVVAIVAILTAIAMPAYNTYLVKARVMELLTLANAYKIKVIDNYYEDNSAISDNLDTNYIATISAYMVVGQPYQYAIDVVAKMKTAEYLGIGVPQPLTAAGPLTIQLRGTQKNEIISWTCHTDQAYAKYVPHNCNKDL